MAKSPKNSQTVRALLKGLIQTGKTPVPIDEMSPKQLAKHRHRWNYRVIAFESTGGDWRAIHEVHYEDDTPVAYSESAATFFWEPTDDDEKTPKQILRRFKDAIAKPVLKASDFEQKSSKRSLKELLAQLDPEERFPIDRDWESMVPVGKEIIGYPADDGALSKKALKKIKSQAKKHLAKGKVISKKTLLKREH